MGKVSETLPPFLAKLLLLTQKIDGKVAEWDASGEVFVINDETKFNAELKKLFKGTTQTFVRQLHFYGFKKVDASSTNGRKKTWGFKHENGLFVKGNSSLLKDIRRKTKVDPESQKLATVYEVQALRSQVSFLQQIVEDLRQKVVKMKKGATASTVKVKMESDYETVVPAFKGFELEDCSKVKKRQRTEESKPATQVESFEEMCSKVSPPARMQGIESPEFTRVPSFASLSSFPAEKEAGLVEFDNFSDLFSDLEIDPIVEDTDPFDQAVEAISDATNVKKTDVSKIISFLSQLSLKEGQQNVTSDKMFAGCQKLENIVPLRIQKVGAS